MILPQFSDDDTPMAFRTFILYLLLLLPRLAAGQQNDYTLTGQVKINKGPTCKYAVTFHVAGNVITGHSVTTAPGEHELKAQITGIIDKKKHLLYFREYNMPLSFGVLNCMFDVQLTYKLHEGKYLFSGVFAGNNEQRDSCDAGTVTLEMKKDTATIFEMIQPKKKPAAPPPAAKEKVAEHPLEFGKITAAIKKEFDWSSDTCILEIWDGEVVDGDEVTLQFNGQKILIDYPLVAEKKRIVLPLSKKINTLSIYAENDGKAPPNTSMILLTDGKLQYGVLACINKGETTEIIIRKK